MTRNKELFSESHFQAGSTTFRKLLEEQKSVSEKHVPPFTWLRYRLTPEMLETAV